MFKSISIILALVLAAPLAIAQDEDRPKEERTIPSIRSAIDRLCKNVKPRQNRPWGEILAAKANAWLADNVNGRLLLVTGEFEKVTVVKNAARTMIEEIRVQMTTPGFEHLGVYYGWPDEGTIELSVEFDQEAAEAIAKLKEPRYITKRVPHKIHGVTVYQSIIRRISGSKIMIRGRVSRMEIDSGSKLDNLVRTEVLLQLTDGELLKAK